jgi:hypothetical protein
MLRTTDEALSSAAADADAGCGTRELQDIQLNVRSDGRQPRDVD